MDIEGGFNQQDSRGFIAINAIRLMAHNAIMSPPGQEGDGLHGERPSERPGLGPALRRAEGRSGPGELQCVDRRRRLPVQRRDGRLAGLRPGPFHSAGVLDGGEATAVLKGLAAVARRVAAGEDLTRFEDVHSAVELLLIEEAGEPGRKLHTGRSRNEQVVTDERLFLKSSLPAVAGPSRASRRPCWSWPSPPPARSCPASPISSAASRPLRPLRPFVLLGARAGQGPDRRRRDAWTSAPGIGGAGRIDRASRSGIPPPRAGLRRPCFENSLDAVSDRSFILESLAPSAWSCSICPAWPRISSSSPPRNSASSPSPTRRRPRAA